MSKFNIPVTTHTECKQVVTVEAEDLQKARAKAVEVVCQGPLWFDEFWHNVGVQRRLGGPPPKVLKEPLIGIQHAGGFRAMCCKVPLFKKVIELACDVFGKNPRLQILAHDEDGEIELALRYNGVGQLVEVGVAAHIRVVELQAPTSPWYVERDGK